MVGSRIGIHYEIALFEELEVIERLGIAQRGFHFAGYHFERIRVDLPQQKAGRTIGLLHLQPIGIPPS